MSCLKQLFGINYSKKKKQATSSHSSSNFSTNLRKYCEDKLNCDEIGTHATICSSSIIEEMRRNFQCDVCFYRHRKCVAVNRCDICRMNMCESCCSSHQRKKEFTNHPVTCLAQMRNTFCSEHRKRYLNYDCMTCCTKVCAMCIMTSHDDNHATPNVGNLPLQTRSIETEDAKENLTINNTNQVGVSNFAEPMTVIVSGLQAHPLNSATDITDDSVATFGDSHTEAPRLTLYDNKRARCYENKISKEQSNVAYTRQERTALLNYDRQSRQETMLVEQPTIFYGTKGLPRAQRMVEGGLLPLILNFPQSHISDNWQSGNSHLNSENR